MTKNLHNSNVKNAYLEYSDAKESTKVTVMNDFKNISKVENDLGKDVYAFNDLEIGDMLMSLGYSNVLSVRRILSILRDYVFWAIANDQRGEYENGINGMDLFLKSEKDLMKYVSNKQISGKILSLQELEDLINIVDNPIDKLFIQCPYEFIAGQEMFEMRSLKMSNVNMENLTVKLFDMDGSEREQKISAKLLKLLEDTESQSEYIFNNGEGGSRARSRAFAESEYIVKPLKRKSSEGQMLTYASIGAKYRRIQEFTGFSYINAVALKDTRIIHEIVDLLEDNDMYKPDGFVFTELQSRLRDRYSVEISPMQLYSIKKKYEQIITIKSL